eukprot:scaffold2401_cov111-Cylindrotheca_fusiformis.AAC.3
MKLLELFLMLSGYYPFRNQTPLTQLDQMVDMDINFPLHGSSFISTTSSPRQAIRLKNRRKEVRRFSLNNAASTGTNGLQPQPMISNPNTDYVYQTPSTFDFDRCFLVNGVESYARRAMTYD